MRARGFFPVFEGKHVDPFTLLDGGLRWWIRESRLEAKYQRRAPAEPLVVFRDIARNTNERTCIACVLPAGMGGSDTLNGVRFERIPAGTACAVMNSLCFNYAVRFRTAGTHLSFTCMRPVAVPPVARLAAVPELPTQCAWESGHPHITDDPGHWETLWQINRTVAEAYGLSAEDFAHILDSFPGLAKKRPEFVAFLRGRVAEWLESGPVK